jgi:hypothetical protein
MLQGVAADCNSAEATHAWFDSRIAHHYPTTLKFHVLLGTLPSKADFWSQNLDRRTQTGPIHPMPKKILHLKENGGRYFYRRRVPERHQKTLGIKMWNRPCGNVSYQKAV